MSSINHFQKCIRFLLKYKITWFSYDFSATCRETYGQPESTSTDVGAETRPLCTSEYSDISPLKGGNVAFSTLEGRPSAYSFDSSPELQVIVNFIIYAFPFRTIDYFDCRFLFNFNTQCFSN